MAESAPQLATRPLDVRALRADFPILDRQVRGGRGLVYLDSAASSQKPKAVIDALSDYYTRYNANVHRGIHTLSEEATDEYEKARRKIQRFINAGHPEELVFVRNTTEAINLVAHSYGERLREGDEILLSEMEHHSNLVPWQMLADRKGARLRFIPLFDDGTLDLSGLGELLTDRTRIVALSHMSNVLGTINPVEEITRRAHEAGAVVLLDAAQSVPHMPVDVQALGCDFLAFSGHKMLGPMGVGVLYGRREILESMPPFLGGGNMIMLVELEHATYNELPDKFEAGTPDAGGAIALGVAVDYLSAIGMDNVRNHEREITDYALEVMMGIDDVALYGPKSAEARGAVIAFNFADIHPHDLGTLLDRDGVAIRAGHHCCQPLMRRLGQVATARASFYVYNTRDEVDALAEALGHAKNVMYGSK
ncbi:MAG: cysteine desulfurase / selenocysteine lyase [Chloroflexota bacterium]|jgi:cysteine desulfurase/selenocysteine lyase|nr:cysteine desulfurase / selenocysteine lyase [Chloroflexota bacterium]